MRTGWSWTWIHPSSLFGIGGFEEFLCGRLTPSLYLRELPGRHRSMQYFEVMKYADDDELTVRSFWPSSDTAEASNTPPSRSRPCDLSVRQ